jgi:hypothetical protein
VQCFIISTSKSGPSMWCFVHVDFEMWVASNHVYMVMIWRCFVALGKAHSFAGRVRIPLRSLMDFVRGKLVLRYLGDRPGCPTLVGLQ